MCYLRASSFTYFKQIVCHFDNLFLKLAVLPQVFVHAILSQIRSGYATCHARNRVRVAAQRNCVLDSSSKHVVSLEKELR